MEYRLSESENSRFPGCPRSRQAEDPGIRIRIVAAYIRYASEPEVRVELALNGSTYTGQARYDASNPVEAAMAAFLNALSPDGPR